MIYTKEIEIGGKVISIETGRYARQANGAVMVRCGDTMVFVVATASKEQRVDIDYFPLSVDYREKPFAAGKIPGGFFKREGRPTEKEILNSRLIDRPIRPLFPEEYKNDTQVIAVVYSYDGENNPDVLGAIGASAALTISDIPLLEPVAQVRVGRLNGEYVINPSVDQTEESDIELVVSGTADSVMMVEGESEEVTESELLGAIKFAHDSIKKLVQVQIDLRSECGVEKMTVNSGKTNDELVKEVKNLAFNSYKEAVATVLGKVERLERNNEINNDVLEKLSEKYPDEENTIKQILHDLEKELMRKQILDEGIRLDGRKTDEIRPISVEVGLLARTHGSALFTRGETQSLTTLTLGTKRDEQIIDGLGDEFKKRFMLHYNFPPFSVGETGRYGAPGRREIGHGNLAERALKYVLPDEAKFPYSIRVNSDIMESNGSSSMATVCAGSLSMMDGGIPTKCAISGIAMGLIKDGDTFKVLSDITGNEDHLGDMDFKVAGSENGITAFQMDIKIQGISFEIMEQALQQAKAGRVHILSKMNEILSQPRENISKYAPVILFTKINPEKIGTVIGPGGKIIQGIQKDFSVDISIEEDGTVNIAGIDKDLALKAKEHIKLLVTEPEVGKTYYGTIMKITDFGAFVEILPGTQGLLHISQIDNKRVEKVSDVLNEGDKVKVKLIKMDHGKFSLSRKILLKDKPEVEDSTSKD